MNAEGGIGQRMDETIGGRQRFLLPEKAVVDFGKKWGVLRESEEELPDVGVLH
jgi:hypothetical protein